jgi:hypothetical protein
LAKKNFARLLGLDPAQLRPVLALAGVYALLGAAVAAGDATVHTIFVARAGADRLPEALLLRAVVSPLLAYLYARLARHRTPRAVLVGLLVLAAAIAVAGRFALSIEDFGPLAAYVIHELVASVLTVHWGVYLLHHLAGDHALRGAPVVFASARLGAALAGVALAGLVTVAGAPSGMYLMAALYLLAAVGTFGAARRHVDARREHGQTAAEAAENPKQASDEVVESPIAYASGDDAARPSTAPARKAGLRLLAHSALLPALAASTVIMVFVRFALRYQQQSLLEEVPEVELGQILSTYTIGANLLGAALQVLLLGRLLPRLGLTRTNTFYALATVGTQIALLFSPGLAAALLARFTDNELKHSVKTPLSSLFYEAFPPKERAGARALVLGVVSPFGQVVGALGLTAMVAGATESTIAAIGAGATVAFGLATWAQNRGYERAIRRARQT